MRDCELTTQNRYALALTAMDCGMYATAVTELVRLGDYQDSRTLLKKALEESRKAAEKVVLSRLEERKPQIRNEQYRLKHTCQNNLDNANADYSAHLEQEQALNARLQQLNDELNRLHGLFTGKKKDALLFQISGLKRERAGVTEKKLEAAAKIERAQTSKVRIGKKIEQLLAEQKKDEEKLEALRARTDDEVIRMAFQSDAKTRSHYFNLYRCHVTFGHLRQSPDPDASTLIEWKVVRVEGSKALLLSRYGLTAKGFHSERKPCKWEDSSIRRWLNGSFLNEAFTEKEKGDILSTEISNRETATNWLALENLKRDNPDDVIQRHKDEIDQAIDLHSGGGPTTDKIFLLSCSEAQRCVSAGNFEESEPNSLQARVSPTDLALLLGAAINEDQRTLEDKPAGIWWLRTATLNQPSVMAVDSCGTITPYVIDENGVCVRPALWVDLATGIFETEMRIYRAL